MELAASVLAFREAQVPATLNYERPDPECPVPVIHGGPMPSAAAAALALTWMPVGQSAALVVAAPD